MFKESMVIFLFLLISCSGGPLEDYRGSSSDAASLNELGYDLEASNTKKFWEARDVKKSNAAYRKIDRRIIYRINRVTVHTLDAPFTLKLSCRKGRVDVTLDGDSLGECENLRDVVISSNSGGELRITGSSNTRTEVFSISLSEDNVAPGNRGDKSFVLQAEDKNVSLINSTIKTNQTGFNGQGFADFAGQNSSVTWNVDYPAGTYKVNVRYGNGADRPSTLIINGDISVDLKLAVQGERSWSNWVTEATENLKINEGIKTIAIDSENKSDGPNLDQIELIQLSVNSAGNNEALNDIGEFGNPRKTQASSGNNKIVLPIEVLGPAKTQKTIEFDVNNAAGITHLYIQCSSCGYRNNELDSNPNMVKARIAVNNGSPMSIKAYTGGERFVGNRSIEFLGPEAKYGGIGGGMRSVEFIIPVEGINEGTNIVDFIHQDPGAPSIGYRILKFNLIRNNNPSSLVLPENMFVDDDPSTWKAPLSSAQDVEQGRILWNKRNHLYDSGLDFLDGQGNGQGFKDGMMKASCADCHAVDGRDLKYFNFSNESIIERSRFHRLSRRQGQQIASYIRGIDIPVVKQARPWNPPYQPGPGLDDKPVYQWAAGAGLDGVLKKDADMEPYLFPNGTSRNAVKKVVDRLSTLNMRELPIALQLPDWNSWLPIVHPSDAFEETRAITSDEDGNRVGMPFYEYLYQEALKDPSAYNLAELTSRIRAWIGQGATCYTQGLKPAGPGWRAANGLIGDSQILSERYVRSRDSMSTCGSKRYNKELSRGFESAKRGLHSWINIKLWEIIHSNNLETQSARVSKEVCFRGSNDCVDASEPRGWVLAGKETNPMAFFSRAPHYIGYNSDHFTDQDLISGLYEGTAWYHFQLIMDPGYRSKATSHFAYTIGHLEKINDESSESQSFRFWATMIKMRQLQTSGLYGKENGLDLRTAQPFRYFSDRRGNHGGRDDVGKNLWAKLIEAFLEDLTEDAAKATQREWNAADQNREVQSSNSKDFSYYSDKNRPYKEEKLQGKNTVRVIPEFRKLGVSEAAISKLIDWCESMWPLGPWDSLR